MADLLIVESKDGGQVAVPAAHFRRKLEPDGWKAVRHESGAEYDYTPPAKAETSAKAAKADEAT
jgi:hypothetical protein